MIAIQGRNQIFQLGKILLSKKPELAQALISEYLPGVAQPMETDLEKIPMFFKRFCQIKQLHASEYIGALYKNSKIDMRRLFVAAIIVLYQPHTRLLSKYISETLQQDPGDTSRMIQQMKFRYDKIEEFKCEVDELVNRIKCA